MRKKAKSIPKSEKKGKKTGKRRDWAGLDLNQRRLTPMGLQPIPFSHSGTDPVRHRWKPAAK